VWTHRGRFKLLLATAGALLGYIVVASLVTDGIAAALAGPAVRLDRYRQADTVEGARARTTDRPPAISHRLYRYFCPDFETEGALPVPGRVV